VQLVERSETVELMSTPRIIGDAPAMRELLEKVERIGPMGITVLIRGETGTGKELIASLIHVLSGRSSGPLVRFNCAAIPGELAEAELFGHARGAFTGADRSRAGFFSRANGGTLVLDEVGELPHSLQAKLLRALQEGEIQQIGTGRVERVDVRVIACTNRDLFTEARRGRFRSDLFYRLAVVELIVPPLRHHREDIPALAREFAHRYGERFGKPNVRLSPSLIEALCEEEWPGNVRELENAVQRMVALSADADEIDVDALSTQQTSPVTDGGQGRRLGVAFSLRDRLAAIERRMILKTLAAVQGNRSHAAKRLGLSRSALIDRLNKYGLASRAEVPVT
jgi:transcriptional regulator with GAF, ATPase, and Fis domain